MFGAIKKMLGLGTPVDYRQILKDGGVIIDVRSPEEYRQGHIEGSKNIPLGSLGNHFAKLNKAKPIITCCASGMRSAQAKSSLQANGFSLVYNGGGWSSLKSKII